MVVTFEESKTNESALTLAWLLEQCGLRGTDAPSPVATAWVRTVAHMHRASNSGQAIIQGVDWASDFWVVRGTRSAAVGRDYLFPAWMPPDDIAAWPSLGVGEMLAQLPFEATRTRRQAFDQRPSGLTAPSDLERSSQQALSAYVALKAGLRPSVFDLPAIQTEHVRVWLAAAVGHLLASVTLSPQGDRQALVDAARYRLRVPSQVVARLSLLDQLADRRLEILYNGRFQPDGTFELPSIRVGQGEEWRDHWVSLCFEVGSGPTRAAVQNAARLMRCPVLVDALLGALSSGEPDTSLISLAVIRRWLLTLEAMAWLEDALTQKWADVRSQDLACFALNAVKPDWPRRTLAISHRSADVKPELRNMQLWRSGRCAIDATYVPSWETNLGMVWGLFAPTPAIARVDSPTYLESVWCRRERELTQYLVDVSDFHSERWILDVELSEVRRLDGAARSWQQERPEELAKLVAEYPPMIEITSPGPMEAWEVAIYRASAALRLMHAVLSDATPALINRLALALQQGMALPPPAVTNNPDGWNAYTRVFAQAAALGGCAGDELAVSLPNDYADAERQKDLALAQRIPDLQHATASIDDVLVALEWLRVEWPQYVDRNRGDFLAINIQRLSKDVWASRDEVSLHRGLAAMRGRLPVPLWVIQLDGQQAETWPLLDQTPIFTEHAAAQFAWMLEVDFGRQESMQRYPEDSGLDLCSTIVARCRGGKEGTGD